MKYSLSFLIFTLLILLSNSSCNDANSPKNYAVDPLQVGARAGNSMEEVNEIFEDDNNLKPFVSKEGRFSILFPGTPKKQVQATPTEVGPIEITMYLYKEGVTLAYLVGHSDYPEEIIKNADSNELLKSAQKGAVANVEAVIITDENIMLDNKYLGKHFTAKSPKISVIYEMYLVGDRLYHIAIMSTQTLDKTPMVKKFMESFKLLGDNNNDAEKIE